MSRKHNKRSNKNKGKKKTGGERASKVTTDEALPDTRDDEDTLEDEDEDEDGDGELAASDKKSKRGRTSKGHKESKDDHEDDASKKGKKSKKSHKSGKPEEDARDGRSKDRGRKNAPRGKGKGSSQTSRRGSVGTRSSRSPRTIDRRQGLTTTSWVWITIACALVGMLFGRFVLTRITGGVIDGSLSGKTTITADQLNAVMGTYTYQGQTYNITVQDVLDATSSQNQVNADGTYSLPSADSVLAVARTRILTKAADDQGITISDDELSQFMQQYAGTTDLDQLASNFGVSADTIKQQVIDTAKISKLRDSVVTTTVPDAPTAPTEPSDGNKDATSKEYADYIINLAGSEWDANTGTWAATDGPYAAALANYTVTPDSASYNAAMTAYTVAAQTYQAAAQQASQSWTGYINGQLAQANLQLSTLVA